MQTLTAHRCKFHQNETMEMYFITTGVMQLLLLCYMSSYSGRKTNQCLPLWQYIFVFINPKYFIQEWACIKTFKCSTFLKLIVNLDDNSYKYKEKVIKWGRSAVPNGIAIHLDDVCSALLYRKKLLRDCTWTETCFISVTFDGVHAILRYLFVKKLQMRSLKQYVFRDFQHTIFWEETKCGM